MTSFGHTPSKAFYYTDCRHWNPRATRIPFSVQSLSKVSFENEATGWQMAATFDSHHGYFDGKERDFEGFPACSPKLPPQVT